MHPGDSLGTISARVQRIAKTTPGCAPIVGRYRVCGVSSPGAPLTGVPGFLQFIVDSADRVVLIEFRQGIRGYVPRGIEQRVAAEWTQEVRAQSTKWEKVAGVLSAERLGRMTRAQRWTTRDSAWSASVTYAGNDTALALTVADERSLAAMRTSSPLADYVLGQRELIGDPTVLPDILIGAMSRELPAMPLTAPPPSEIAECELELADVALPARSGEYDSDARTSFGADAAGMIERAVPVAYPGWRVVFGKHIYLVSPTGTAEQVSIRSSNDYQSSGLRAGERVYAFAIMRTRRADSARRRIESFDPAQLCGSRADVVFVRTAATGAIAESVRVPLDEDAPLSVIGAIEFAPTSTDRSTLIVGYVSSYLTDSLRGDIEWRAEVATDPPRMVGRIPVSFRRILRATPEDTSRAGIILAQLANDTLALHTLEEHESSVATHSVRLPLASGKAIRGLDILERLP